MEISVQSWREEAGNLLTTSQKWPWGDQCKLPVAAGETSAVPVSFVWESYACDLFHGALVCGACCF